MKQFRFIAIALLISIFVFESCTSEFEDMNRNPVQLNEIPADYLFTYSLRRGSMDAYIYQRAQMLFCNHFAQYYANSATYFQTDRYESADAWATDFWNESYVIYLSNIQAAINFTAEDPQNGNKQAMAKIWKVFLFHRLTDFFGDVPYSEALKDKDFAKYDKQEDIYKDMLNELKEAVALLDEDLTGNYGNADLFFKGDVDKWRRFGNSLRLRLAMRVAKVAPALAQQHIAELATAPLMASNSNSALMPTETPGQGYRNQNPLGTISGWNEFRVSKTMVDMLKTYNDPRLTVYADVNKNGEIVGLQNGLSKAQLSEPQNAATNFSNTGKIFQKLDYPTPIFQYSELCFLMAEATLRGWATGSTKEWYEKGISASLNFYEITNQSTVNDYLASSNVAWSETKTFEEKLKMIITQKWIANFNDGWEGWAEYRRTGYPVFMPIGDDTGGETNGEVPHRVKYPISEQTLNSQNYNDAISRLQAGDEMTSPVWWDVE